MGCESVVPGEVPDRAPPGPFVVLVAPETAPVPVVGWFAFVGFVVPEIVPVPLTGWFPFGVTWEPVALAAVPVDGVEWPAAPAAAEVAGCDTEEFVLAPE